MKKNKIIKHFLLLSTLTLMSTAVVFSNLKDVSIANAALLSADPSHEESNWFTLDVNPTEEEVEGNPIHSVSLLLSPLPQDYRSLSKSSVSSLANGIMQGVKDIASTQIKFIAPVGEPERKANEDWNLNPTEEIRPSVLSALVDGVLRTEPEEQGETGEVIVQNVQDFDSTILDGDIGLNASSGAFLNTMLTYMAAYGQDGSTSPELVAVRLGLSVNDGAVSPLPSSTTYQQLVSVYQDMGQANAEEKALNDMQVIYDNAIGVATNSELKTEAIVKIFDGLEETAVPVKTVINVLGAQNTLDSVKAIFIDKNVSTQYAEHFLNELTQRTMADICDVIQLELYDPNTGTGGFTKDDIMESFDLASNERLMEIFGGLNSNGLNNIRIILGKPVDYSDGGYTPTDPEPVRRAHLLRSGSASREDYAEFGSKLMEIIMERISVSDLIHGITKFSLTYEGVSYPILEKPIDPVTNKPTNNLQLRLHNIVDLLNALPKMSELENYEDGSFFLDMKAELTTVLNDRDMQIDDVTGEVISDEYVPIEFNFKVGFQDKDCKYLRKLAEILNDTFDLTFDFDDNDNLKFDLVTRNPDFVSNIYAWFIDSGFIKNEGDKKLLNELWNVLFSSLDEIKEYIKEQEVSDLVEDLKNIDYEVALNTITSAEALNEIISLEEFEQLELTDYRLERIVNIFNRLVKKATNYTYDDILELVESINEGIASKLDKDILRKLFDKVEAVLRRVAGKNISIEMLQGISNDSIYNYVEKITGKEDLILRARDLVVRLINRLPQKVRNISIMDAYRGNGEFSGSGKVYVSDADYEKVIKKLPKGDRLWVIFDGILVGHDRPASYEFSFDSYFKDIYSVEFEWEVPVENRNHLTRAATKTMSKTGILHVGSDVMSVATVTEDVNGKIVHWVDKNEEFKRVDKMVDYDVTLVPEYEYGVEISDDIEKVYDGTGSLTVTPVGDFVSYYNLSYQWQKLEDDLETWTDLAGETSDTLERVNVLDSGTYRCEVTASVEGYDDIVVYSAPANVEITPKPIDVTSITWDYSKTIAYDGEEKEVLIDTTSITGELATALNSDISYEGNKATDVGTYQAKATFTLADEDNYCFLNDVDYVTLDWEIENKVYVFEATWLDIDEFKYDGNNHNAMIDPDSYAEFADKVTVSYETKLISASDDEYVSGGQYKAGEYITKAIFTSIDPDYVVDASCAPAPKPFTIYKEIDLNEVEWSNHSTFEYDGSEHSVYVRYFENIEEIAGISYSNDSNTQTNAGEYTTIANPIYAEGYNSNTVRFINNHVFGEENARIWSISKNVIEVKHICWDYTEPFTYDGENHSVSVLEGCLPEQIGYEIIYAEDIANSATNAGTYVAAVSIFVKPEYADNYELSDDSILIYTLMWYIHPQGISLSDVTWSDESSPLIYNEETQTVTIDSNSEFYDIVSITYVNNSATNAGEYQAVAILTIVGEDNQNNYYLIEDVIFHDYEIAKQEISVSNVEWNYNSTTTYLEDGEEKEVHVTSFTNSELVDVTYNNNGFTNAETDAGSYQAQAVFTIKDEYKDNYVLVGNTTAVLDWKINEVQPNLYFMFDSTERTNNEYNARVELENGIVDNPTLHAELGNGEAFKDAEIDFKSLVGGNGEVSYSYSLYFELNDENYDVGENEFTTYIQIPEELIEQDYAIVILNDDGTVTEADVEYTEDGKYAVIYGDFVKNIGFVTKIERTRSFKDNPAAIPLIILVVLGQIIFVIATVLVAKKIRKSRE